MRVDAAAAPRALRYTARIIRLESSMTHALVTGANRGLGLEFTRQLLAGGARVIAACRHPGRATDLTALAAAHPGHLHVLPLDVAKPSSIVELAREAGMVFDALDLLINNAGMLVAGERFGSLGADNLDASFRSNAIGPLLLTQALAPLLAKGERARVANLSSVMGSMAQTHEFRSPSYSISKAALNMVTVQLAHALAAQGTIVLALHPGWARTDMGGSQATVDPPDAVAGMLRVVRAAKTTDSGAFRDWQGKAVPW
jgi:NAD(P)-dependent dehydrogenase (short-subunit alcohol dehydrogenase family)